MHPGRHGPEFRGAPGLRGAGLYRQEQGLGGDAGAAHACDAGGERGGRAAGGAADPVRGAGREGGEGQAAGAAQDVPLDPGAAGVRGAGRTAGRSAAGVGDGPGGGRVRAVRGAAPAEESGPAGAGEAQPFAGRGRAEATRALLRTFDWVRAEPAQGRLQLHVARLSARRASRGQKGSAAREEREAQVELRWREVELADPDRQEAALKLRLVHVREQTQPEGAERLEWFLLTTLAVQTQQQAERVLEWYKLRWRIEDWYRVLKSGCKVEYLGHRQGERIERAVTINAVIAWRLTLMTLLGRDTPELPADTLFTEIELATLGDFAQDRRQPPPDNLGRAVLTLAMLGGYLNYKRKQYAVPGHKVMWEGYTRLATIAQTVERTRRLNEASLLYQKMRPA